VVIQNLEWNIRAGRRKIRERRVRNSEGGLPRRRTLEGALARRIAAQSRLLMRAGDFRCAYFGWRMSQRVATSWFFSLNWP
jgi:hypothetical protein